MLNKNRCAPLTALGALAALWPLALAAVPAQAAGTDTVNLSGHWIQHPGDNGRWMQIAAPEIDWQAATLPGAPSGSGFTWYRKHFTVPANWANDPSLAKYKRLYLHLGELSGAAEVYINGSGVARLGKLPAASGTGLQAIPATSDVIATLPSDVNGKPLLNYGQDNIIAIRLYNPLSGPDPSAGPIEIDLPTTAQLYHLSLIPTDASRHYEGNQEVRYTVRLTNASSEAADVSWTISIADPTGRVIYTSSPTTTQLASGGQDDIIQSLTLPPHAGFYTFTLSGTVGDQHLTPSRFVAGWHTPAGAVAPGSSSPSRATTPASGTY